MRTLPQRINRTNNGFTSTKFCRADLDGAGLSKAATRVDTDADASGRVQTCAADVADEAQVKAYAAYARDELGGIDAFYNNAGIEGVVAHITEYPTDMF